MSMSGLVVTPFPILYSDTPYCSIPFAVSSSGRSSRSLPGRAALLPAPQRAVAVNLSSHTDPTPQLMD